MLPAKNKATAFWVYKTITIRMETREELDWDRLVANSNGELSIQTNEVGDGGSVMGNQDRTVDPGVYGVMHDGSFFYVLGSDGDADVHVKAGKDPWPLPPPTRPQGFDKVKEEQWKKNYEYRFLGGTEGEPEPEEGEEGERVETAISTPGLDGEK